MKKAKTKFPCRLPVSEINWAEVRRLKRIWHCHSVDEVITLLIRYVNIPRIPEHAELKNFPKLRK